MAMTSPSAPKSARALGLPATPTAVVLGGLGALVLFAAVIALAVGPVWIPPAQVLEVLGRHLAGGGDDDIADRIVWMTRTPRIALALVAGAGLGIAGAALQSVVRNDLADPYLLGVNAGASTAVALVVLVAGGATGLALSGSALLGGLASTMLVLFLAGPARTRGPLRVILAGLAVGYALNAATSFLLFWSDSPEASRSVLFWLLGSLASVQLPALVASIGVSAIGIVALTWAGPYLDALASGDDSTLSAGLDPERLRFVVIGAVSAMVGVLVAGVGGVGFIGLAVPHLARALVGGRHRVLIPASAALGALFLVIADTVARTAFAPQEIPVGVVTGVIGAPALLLLLRRTTRTP